MKKADAPVLTRSIAPRLWVAEHPLVISGVDISRRMTVVRLADGGLWLHSVCRLAPDVRAWLDGLGPVRFVVSPNAAHHFFMEQYAAAYPEARLVASPGLPEKRTDLAFHSTLGDRPDPGWAGDLEQTAFRGTKRPAGEVEFFHPASRTLILTDLCFHFTRDDPFLTRLAGRLVGTYGRLGVARDVRWAMRDREAARVSVERILAWDFDLVIVAHGAIVETGGRQAFREAFAWLLGKEAPPAA